MEALFRWSSERQALFLCGHFLLFFFHAFTKFTTFQFLLFFFFCLYDVVCPYFL